MKPPLDGWELTQGVMIMVRAVLEEGHLPCVVLMHPDDFADLRDWKGAPLSKDATFYDVPIRLDERCERGKILALKEKV